MAPTLSVPRAYDSSRRRVAVEATRARILEAARSLMGGKSDLGEFSMESVAEKAGVSRMTVYYQFKSRSGLLEALADHLAQRGGMARMRDVFTEPSLAASLRTLVGTFVGFWASDRVVLRRMRAMAITAPTDAAAPRDRDAWRREAIANLLLRHRYAPAGPRARSVEDLTDLVAMLTSFEVFDLLCTGGRTPARVAELLTASVLRELDIAPAQGVRSHSR